MMNHERTERSADAGLHPELGETGNQLQDQLAATLAHELGNPLTSILAALHVLRHRDGDEAVTRQAHHLAERQTRHMARIIEDVLDICRAGQDKLRLRKQRVDLAAVVVDAIDSAGPCLNARGHHLTVSLPPEPVSLMADAARLTQILTNLLTNAAKYTDPCGEIGLAVEVVDGVVVLRVRDNGRGIAPDLLPRIFDLFQQGDRAGNGACGGLRIGLTLVKSLVELHSGSITAFSRGPGTGSEFVVRLPHAATKSEEGPVPAVVASVLSFGIISGPWFWPAQGRGWHVLLAAGAVALTALGGLVWWYAARSTRRWKVAVDAYAAREIARDRRKNAPPL